MGKKPVAPIAVRTSGLIDRRPWHSTLGTYRDDIMLTVFTAGRGSYQQGGRTQAILPGMIGLVPPDQPGVLAADPDDPYVHWYCRFNGSYALQLARQVLAERDGQRFCIDSRCERVAEIAPRLGRLARQDALPGIMGQAELALTEILLLLVDAPGSGERDGGFGADALRDYLQVQIDQPTELAAIASHFRVSVRTLTRQCRAWTGRSLQALHEDMKMAWALALLRGTDDPIATIARRAGYGDPAYFSRVYRRHYGRPPSSERR